MHHLKTRGVTRTAISRERHVRSHQVYTITLSTTNCCSTYCGGRNRTNRYSMHMLRIGAQPEVSLRSISITFALFLGGCVRSQSRRNYALSTSTSPCFMEVGSGHCHIVTALALCRHLPVY